MPQTQLRGTQALDGTWQRQDLDAVTAGFAVIRKGLSGSGISSTQTGPDAGTGDVTYSLSQFNERTPGSSAATLLNTDGIVYMSFAGANTLTIQPTSSGSYVSSQVVNVVQTGVGKTQIVAAAGVTFINPGSLYLRTKGSIVTLKRIGATDTWIVSGDTDDAVALPNVFFKGSRTASISIGNSFTTVPMDSTGSNVGGGSYASGIYTIPVAGIYDVTGALRIADNLPAYSVGLGINTSNADSPDFYWGTNAASAGSPSERFTFQYSNRLTFAVNDPVRLFAFCDNGTAQTFVAASLAIKLIG